MKIPLVVTTFNLAPIHAVVRYNKGWWIKRTPKYAIALDSKGHGYKIPHDDKVFNKELIAYVRQT
jgi:hypothetical protein